VQEYSAVRQADQNETLDSERNEIGSARKNPSNMKRQSNKTAEKKDKTKKGCIAED
jgi:hypothetical protein